MENYEVRIAREEDVEAIRKIYAYYVEDTSVTFEYVVPNCKEFLERYETTIQRYPYLVLVKKDDKQIIGYAYASAFKGRAAYDWSVETTVYLHKEARGNGLGEMLYLALEEYLEKQNVVNLNACITQPNPRSVSFHEKLHYTKAAHFHKCGYKFQKWYDVMWMEKMIGEHKDIMDDFIPFKDLVE